MRISCPKNTAPHPEDLAMDYTSGFPALRIQLHTQKTSLWCCRCATATFSPMWDNWYSLEAPHRWVLQSKKGAFLFSGTSKVTCVRPWDRTGWLAWWWWLCIPVMHRRWTPRPSCRTTGKPLVLPVSCVWPTGIYLALRRTCHQHACFIELLVSSVGFVFLCNESAKSQQ